MQFPAPQRIPVPPLVNYGYEDDVLLPVRITAPRTLPTGAVKLQANLRWVVCREVCIAGKGVEELSLPVVAAGIKPPPSPERALFESTRSHLPQALPAAWKLSVVAQKDDFVLTARVGRSMTEVTFFPAEPLIIENAVPQELHPVPQGFRLSLKKSEQLLKPISRLKGVLVLTGSMAYKVDAPVSPSQGAPNPHTSGF